MAHASSCTALHMHAITAINLVPYLSNVGLEEIASIFKAQVKRAPRYSPPPSFRPAAFIGDLFKVANARESSTFSSQMTQWAGASLSEARPCSFQLKFRLCAQGGLTNQVEFISTSKGLYEYADVFAPFNLSYLDSYAYQKRIRC